MYKNSKSALKGLFHDFTSLTDISGLSSWDVSAVTSMYSMFRGCSSLSDISPLTNWKTGLVTDMGLMFYNCPISSLEPFKNWDTSAVTSMTSMFSGCCVSDVSPLKNWKTGIVTNMNGMFSESLFEDLSALSGWDTSSVYDMDYVFSNNSNLTDVTGIANWDMSALTRGYNLFGGCKNLTALDLTFLNKATKAGSYPARYIAMCTSKNLKIFTLPNSIDKFLDSSASYEDNCFDVSYIKQAYPENDFWYKVDDGSADGLIIKEATEKESYAKLMQLWDEGSLLGKTVKILSDKYVETFTVKFVDWDKTVLKTQEVEKGSAATAPDAPVRDDYTFTGCHLQNLATLPAI